LTFTTKHDLGMVLVAGTRVRLWPGTIREPDIAFMRKEHAGRMINKFWKGADLVMEIVSGGAEDRNRDLKVKRQGYAKAGIPEYWIVDPREELITVLRLDGKEYAVHGEYPQGATATSHLLPGFSVDVTTAFAQRLPSASAKQPRKPRRPKQP
jgi:Uma2 family endonuclease